MLADVVRRPLPRIVLLDVRDSVRPSLPQRLHTCPLGPRDQRVMMNTPRCGSLAEDDEVDLTPELP